MASLSDYDQQSGDWRRSIRQNTRKTHTVIFTFVLIYALVGLCVDVYVYSDIYHVPPNLVVAAFGHGQLFPYATSIMLVIAVVSLLISHALHNQIMLLGTDAHEITAETASNLAEKQLYNVVEEMKIAAGLQYMPRIFVIPAAYMNAFASGFTEKSAMVAITQGLLEKLSREELKAVMAHELSHIRHLDIKLTLTVAVLSNIMLIVIDLLFRFLFVDRRRDDGKNGLFMAVTILRFVLPVVTILLTLYLSRTREFMADAGAVELMRDNTPLATALLKIDQDYNNNQDEYNDHIASTSHEEIRRAAYLYDPTTAGISGMASLSNFFSTHPTLADRLKAIGFVAKGK